MTVEATKKRQISDLGLQHRLALGAATKGGQRGSLTRCAVRIAQLGGGESSSTTEESSEEECLRELQLLQVEMNKLYGMIQRTQQEVEETDASFALEQEIAAELEEVKRLRTEVNQASLAQSCQLEYEALAKLATSRHPTPRRVLQQQLDDVKQQLEQAKRETLEKEGHVKVREAQFQLLMQCILDLKQSLNEPLELDEKEKAAVLDDKEEEEGEEDAKQEAEPMQEDDKEEDEDDEEGLYTDL